MTSPNEVRAVPGAPPKAALVELCSGGFEAHCLVQASLGERLTLEILATQAGAAPVFDRDDPVTVILRGACLRASWPTVVEDGRDFPLLAVRVTGPPQPLPEGRCARIALTFPVRYQVLAADSATLAQRLRKRLDIKTETAPNGPPGREPEELALLALAKLMARLDARFDRVLESGHRGRERRPARLRSRERSQDVVIFSLAKLMMSRLDRKFDRLLAALRDSSTLGRSAPPAAGEEGKAGAHSPELTVLHALTRLLERLNEKFELVVARLDGSSEHLSLDDAWGLGASEEGVMLGLPKPLALDEIVDLDLQLPLFPPVPLLSFGRVVEVSERPEDVPERRFRAFVEFIALPEADRDLLVRLVFRKQREWLRARHARAAGESVE